jgi:hypothetical protein
MPTRQKRYNSGMYKKRQQTKIQSGRPAGGGGMKICMSSLDHKKLVELRSE